MWFGFNKEFVINKSVNSKVLEVFEKAFYGLLATWLGQRCRSQTIIIPEMVEMIIPAN